MKKDEKKNSGETTRKNDEQSAGDDFSESESELRQPIWSVVSFEQCVAKNLNYEKAAAKIAELEKQGVSGLCLVTNSVAERIAAS